MGVTRKRPTRLSNCNELRDSANQADQRREGESPFGKCAVLFRKTRDGHVRSQSPVTIWALWAQPLWRAALSCVAITMLCGVWSMADLSSSDSSDLSQDFESAVYAGLTQHVEDAAW